MTLWGRSAKEQGAELEALPHPLVSLSQCRVTDYNGARPGLYLTCAVCHPLQRHPGPISDSHVIDSMFWTLA